MASYQKGGTASKKGGYGYKNGGYVYPLSKQIPIYVNIILKSI